MLSMTKTLCGILSSLLTLTLPVLAQASPGRPGLWEVSTALNFGVGGYQIAPQQIEQMRQFGIEVPGLSRPFVARQCITPEQAAKDGLPSPNTGDSGCALANVRQRGTVWIADIACSGSLQGSGTLSAHFDSTEHFTGTWSFRGRSAQVPTEIEMSNPYSGRWLGASCDAR
jgi:hypothetical protein